MGEIIQPDFYPVHAERCLIAKREPVAQRRFELDVEPIDLEREAEDFFLESDKIAIDRCAPHVANPGNLAAWRAQFVVGCSPSVTRFTPVEAVRARNPSPFLANAHPSRSTVSSNAGMGK